ncbi:Uncharacterized conserved protein, contains HEPN domain [Pilibacter termitis]|uniref:Uncharacterized conserved protein, contains HEPN domain n=1 Tax=Pilibacter termitis TaxID=263852 RepID=A0A1T4MC50_9ENTE|nr:HepT-like ribonuclease domain-containing protein [Pilibacter termitis]SJZ64451.1 Uncharacterized conserved protein, contains HEPN domain [Pilibacter termitis]
MKNESKETDILYLREMIYYAEKVEERLNTALRYNIPLDDEMVLDSLVMNIGQIGEQLDEQKLSSKIKEKYSSCIPWKEVKNFRNLAYHAYGKINKAEVMEIVKNDIPVLIENLYFIVRKELEE